MGTVLVAGWPGAEGSCPLQLTRATHVPGPAETKTPLWRSPLMVVGPMGQGTWGSSVPMTVLCALQIMAVMVTMMMATEL